MQTTTMAELIVASIAVRYGLGNHMTVIVEKGQQSNFLLWLWTVCFLFDFNVALGKVAAASFLIALHDRACKYIQLVANSSLLAGTHKRQIIYVVTSCTA